MRFGRTLRHSRYEPWKANYIDYEKLKNLLREYDEKGESSQLQKGEREWTEEDEVAFVEELINVQLEKVNSFQVETYKSLRDSTSDCEVRLEKLMNRDHEQSEQRQGSTEGEKYDEKGLLQAVSDELDVITHGINELEKYSRINFTGFLKAAKKHDRRRGSKYRVRPLLQVRLAALPFNSEDYSPLLYRSAYFSLVQALVPGGLRDTLRLSVMYSFIRQRLADASDEKENSKTNRSVGEKYRSHKCIWMI